MAVYCSKCGKKVGILAAKYKTEDGSIICSSCLKEYKMEQEELKRQEALKRQEELRKQKEKNREIMKDHISKYLTNKNPENPLLIRRVCCEAFWIESFWNLSKKIEKYRQIEYNSHAINRVVLKKAIKERPECVGYIKTLINFYETPYIEKSQDFLRNCRLEYQNAVFFLESSRKPGLCSSELDEIARDIKMWEEVLFILDDLEKMDRFFKENGIETTYLEILSIFYEVNEIRGEEIAHEEVEFERKQREKGLVKFVGDDRVERWGTPEQVKRWEEIKVGLSNNFSHYTPYEFEKFIGELFKKMGYSVEVTPATKDYGVDIVAKEGGNIVAIQVKKYAKGNNVGAKEVQQTLGAMWKVNANKSILITTSGFSVYAKEQVKEAPIELWDKKILHELVRKYMA